MQIMAEKPIKMSIVYVVLVWTVLILLLPVSKVHAYNYSICLGDAPIGWVNSNATMFIHTPSFPRGGEWDSAIQSAMAHWSNVKGSNFRFSADYIGGIPGLGNLLNEIYYTTEGIGDDILAYTVMMPALCYPECPLYVCDCGNCVNCNIRPPLPWECCRRPPIIPSECTPKGTWVEADIIFNWNKSWTTGTFDYSNPWTPPYNFESVALHELGHALGLSIENHVDNIMATMNSHYPNSGPLGDSVEWDPLTDDRAGLRFLYNNGATETDIAASALKRTGAGTSWIVDAPTPAGWVAQGSTVHIEYTISNQGTSSQTFNTGFYLSSDKNISTSDILTGTVTDVMMNPGTDTYTRDVTIAVGTPPGAYYLGFIVDYDNALAENNESNNSQYIPYQIYVLPRLSVNKSGTGTGTVTSWPAGINCGTGVDCSGDYYLNTSVTLTATPSVDSSFEGWSGDCSGNGNCQIIMNVNKSVTATFNKLPPVADFACSPLTEQVPFVVQCTDLSARPSTWLWNFGDNTTSSSQNPTHIYVGSGSYAVSLTVSNVSGNSTKSMTNYIAAQSCMLLPVRILGATPQYYATLQQAYDAAVDQDVIQSQGIDFTENLSVNRNISVTLQGGYDCSYTPNLWIRDTNLKGAITTSAGALTIGNYVLQN